MKAEARWLEAAREGPKPGALGIQGTHDALKHLLRCLKDLESFLGPELLGLQGEEKIGRAHV